MEGVRRDPAGATGVDGAHRHGRDAADTAILTALGGAGRPAAFTVLATSDPHLPVEDVDALVVLR